MDQVANYIERQPEHIQKLLYYLYDYFLSYPNIISRYKYRIPFYYQKTWVCYTNVKKAGTVELVFVKGRELSEYPTLMANGRKMARGITYSTIESIDHTILDPLWLEALTLDLNVPYTFKKN